MKHLPGKYLEWVLYSGQFSFWASKFNLYHFDYSILICVHWEDTEEILVKIWWHACRICHFNINSRFVCICGYITLSKKKATWSSYQCAMCHINKSGHMILFKDVSCPCIQMAGRTDVNVKNPVRILLYSPRNPLGILTMNTKLKLNDKNDINWS